MRVLYVEDNPLDVTMTRRGLRKTLPRAHLEVATTVAEAIDRLEREPAFDAALTDMHLPDGTAMELLKHIRGNALPMAVVVITGSGDEATAVAVLKAGADDYLVKQPGQLDRVGLTLLAATQRFRIEAARRARAIAVLYAEPDEAVAALTRQRLAYTAPNLHLEVVGTGADLLARLSGRSRHDLVLLESRLPDVSPLEVLKELRLGRRLDVPVILLLRPEDAELAVQATRLGASDYIIKSPGYLHELQVELESSFYRNELAREQHALRASEARFRELLEDLPAGVLLVGPGGDILFCNQAGSKIFGRPREEILRKLASDDDWVFVREDGTPLRSQDRPVQMTLSTGKPVHNAVLSLPRPDMQGQLWLLCNAVPCFGSDGQVEEVLLAFIDITEHTERKRAEDQLLRERAAAEAASRAKDEFLAMLAHELRNPLGAVRNSLEILTLRGNDPGSIDQCRRIMARQVQHLSHLVDDILDVSRLTRGKIRLERGPVDLADVVAFAVESSRPLVEARQHQLLVELPAEPLVVDGDPDRLGQVFTNLLTNAAKYTAIHGQIALVGARRGDQVVITVRDNGVGIASESLPHIFDLYAQVESSLGHSQGGLGIGLTLVRSLVEMHGGTVEARSDGAGRGSEFVVTLPSLPAAALAELPLVTEAAVREPAGRRRVLIVDDNVDSAETLAEVLELSGHETSVAHDGIAALESARLFRPDVVLLDLHLPMLDGREVARRMRGQAMFKASILVAMTADAQEDNRTASLEAGFQEHLVKPIDLARLEALLRAAPP